MEPLGSLQYELVSAIASGTPLPFEQSYLESQGVDPRDSTVRLAAEGLLTAHRQAIDELRHPDGGLDTGEFVVTADAPSYQQREALDRAGVTREG